MEGLSAAQFQTNYTFGLMKMAMRDAEAQAQEMIEMMSEVAAPAQYNLMCGCDPVRSFQQKSGVSVLAHAAFLWDEILEKGKTDS